MAFRNRLYFAELNDDDDDDEDDDDYNGDGNDYDDIDR